MSRTTPQRRRSSSRRRAGEVVSAARPIAERIATESDRFLWDVEFRREAGRDTLTVLVDRRGGIGSDEIASYAEALSRALDAAEAVGGEERYVLEVASPGAERRLRTPDHFRVCEGREVRITFLDSRPPLEGVISSADDDSVAVDVEGQQVRVPLDDISQARLNVRGV